MLKIYKQHKAEDDLINIWLYSFNSYGETKADTYLDELEQTINRLADHPRLGTRCDYIRKGYMKIPVNKHIVFYRLESDKIHVIRVLHKSMLPQNYL